LSYDQLQSNYVEGNTWYFNGEKITGATSSTYSPQNSGSYSVEVKVNGCSSLSSDYEFVVTSNEQSVNDGISLYPNPVAEGMFRVTFSNGNAGRYDIQVVDLTGRLIQQKPVAVGNGIQVEQVELNNKLAKGMYLVKVLSNNKKIVYTDKIIVE
ncbi:MAG: T9SS type A sorting domain-containing protein, partial [Chitinophagaceae bacterium]|nr:T9SS type A sorting domain-containing protein [Chitinophagaceae bacterium]